MAVKKVIGKDDSRICGSCDQENREPISEAYDVVLHIGAPKTGSSALQAFCIKNRDVLREAGFYYPEHSLDKNNVSGGHSRLGNPLINKDFDTAKNVLDEWLSRSRRDRLCLLVSAESLYGQSKRLKRILSKYRVLVISYFRDPVESIVSNYNQRVKRHFETSTLESYIKRKIIQEIPGVSGGIYDLWVEDFGSQNLIVFPYEKSSFPQEKIELSFLEMLGIPESLVSEFKIEDRLVNTSYSLPVLELMRLFNHVLTNENYSISGRIDRCLQGYSDVSDSCSLSKYEQMGSELYNLLIRKFQPSNDYVKKNILICYSKYFLEYESVSQKTEKVMVDYKILEKVISEAFVDDVDLIESLRKSTLEYISSNSPGNYYLYKLAGLLGISDENAVFEDVEFKEVIFDSRQMDIFLSVKSSEADLLREISIMLERCGQYEQAYKIIGRAAELRPKGQAIIAIRDRLKNILTRID